MTDDLDARLDADPLKTDDLMVVVRERVSRGGSSGRRVGALELLEAEVLEVLHAQDFVLPEIVLGDQEWDLEPHLRISSHRKGGGLIVGAKRLMMPLVRWILDYSQRNFMRQRRLNQALIATLETVAARNHTLELEVERLRQRLDEAPAPGSSEDASARPSPAGETD